MTFKAVNLTLPAEAGDAEGAHEAVEGVGDEGRREERLAALRILEVDDLGAQDAAASLVNGLDRIE